VGGWGGALTAEAVRRLACDATVTRAIVRRHPDQAPAAPAAPAADGALAARLRSGLELLPPPLGALTQLLDLGRATRVIPPALRRALAVRDGGCVAAGCDRPAPWADAHHLIPWFRGGPTDLDNLVLLCRSHHRAVHEGGWRAQRDPATGQVTLSPPAHVVGRPPPPG
jgi:HNH endonuclease